jgi:hypothetical protein
VHVLVCCDTVQREEYMPATWSGTGSGEGGLERLEKLAKDAVLQGRARPSPRRAQPAAARARSPCGGLNTSLQDSAARSPRCWSGHLPEPHSPLGPAATQRKSERLSTYVTLFLYVRARQCVVLSMVRVPALARGHGGVSCLE